MTTGVFEGWTVGGDLDLIGEGVCQGAVPWGGLRFYVEKEGPSALHVRTDRLLGLPAGGSFCRVSLRPTQWPSLVLKLLAVDGVYQVNTRVDPYAFLLYRSSPLFPYQQLLKRVLWLLDQETAPPSSSSSVEILPLFSNPDGVAPTEVCKTSIGSVLSPAPAPQPPSQDRGSEDGVVPLDALLSAPTVLVQDAPEIAAKEPGSDVPTVVVVEKDSTLVSAAQNNSEVEKLSSTLVPTAQNNSELEKEESVGLESDLAWKAAVVEEAAPVAIRKKTASRGRRAKVY